jgi:hypothetical protein
VSEEYSHDNLHAEGRIGEKECLVTIGTWESITITMLDISAGLPERDPPTQCALRMASGETLSVLKEAFVTLTQGSSPLTTWVFFASITDEFILVLDVMHTHYAPVDLRRQMLQLTNEEVPLQEPREQPRGRHHDSSFQASYHNMQN